MTPHDRALEAAAIEGSNAFKAALRVMIERDPYRVPAAAVLRDAIVAYLAEAGDGWRPIESAPKDGTWILVCLDDGSITTAGRHNDDAWALWIGVVDTDNFEEPPAPTHWMPLPAPPPAQEKK